MTTTATPAARPEPPQPATRPTGARLAADITDVDLTDPHVFVPGPPFAAFDALRVEGGIAWHDEQPVGDGRGGVNLTLVDSPGFWCVTAYEQVREVLKDQGRFSSWVGSPFLPTMAPESLAMYRQMMISMDPPEHHRLRRILHPVFTPKAVGALRESIDRIAGDLVAALPDGEPIDLVTAVNAEMPILVLADLLGMPTEDHHLIYEWSNAMVGGDDPDAGPSEADIATVASMMQYGAAMAADRRVSPRDDLVTRIVQTPDQEGGLTDGEIAMLWQLLIVAGNETTRNALSGAVVALHEQGLWGELRDHPEQLSVAVEELLRFVSPVQHFRRTATEDTVLGDQRVRAGDKVVVWFPAANRDPAVFADPHRLDLTRDPNPHLVFGLGNHFCLGAHLARLEVYEVMRRLLPRAATIDIEGPVRHAPTNFINGINHLTVTVNG